MLSLFIQLQVNQTFPSLWNVAVFRKQDLNSNFYLTGTPDSTHTNKRYYEVANPESFSFSVLILQTNNTDVGSSKKEEKVSNLQSYKTYKQSKSFLMNTILAKTIQSTQGGLQYTKKKSPRLTTAQ